MLLSTLINQGVRKFHFKLQKMFTLSEATAISYMAYPSLWRRERIWRNSQGELILEAVGGRRGKENKQQKPQQHKAQQSVTSHPTAAASTAFPVGWGRTQDYSQALPPLVLHTAGILALCPRPGLGHTQHPTPLCLWLVFIYQ